MLSTELEQVLNRFDEYIEKKDFTRVLNECKDLLKKYPKEADLFYYLARAEKVLDNKKLALEHFTKAINLNSKYQKAYNERGLLLCSNGAAREALRDFDIAIELNEKM